MREQIGSTSRNNHSTHLGVKEIKDEVKDSVDGVTSVIDEIAHKTVADAKEFGKRAYNDVSDITKKQAAKLEGEIKDRPLTSVAIAIGLGFLLGSLIRR